MLKPYNRQNTTQWQCHVVWETLDTRLTSLALLSPFVALNFVIHWPERHAKCPTNVKGTSSSLSLYSSDLCLPYLHPAQIMHIPTLCHSCRLFVSPMLTRPPLQRLQCHFANFRTSLGHPSFTRRRLKSQTPHKLE